jgi:hypothetical protein
MHLRRKKVKTIKNILKIPPPMYLFGLEHETLKWVRGLNTNCATSTYGEINGPSKKIRDMGGGGGRRGRAAGGRLSTSLAKTLDFRGDGGGV